MLLTFEPPYLMHHWLDVCHNTSGSALSACTNLRSFVKYCNIHLCNVLKTSISVDLGLRSHGLELPKGVKYTKSIKTILEGQIFY